jgi:Amiloride-sensitive sodium channel
LIGCCFNNILQTEAVTLVSKLDLIQKNFIQLNIRFDEPHPYVIADSPAMTLDDLLSSFGGTLSLWLGITVMFLVELVDLFISFVYAIFPAYLRKKRTETPSTTTKAGSSNVINVASVM